jgi:hypothetical protein
VPNGDSPCSDGARRKPSTNPSRQDRRNGPKNVSADQLGRFGGYGVGRQKGRDVVHGALQRQGFGGTM